MRLLRLFLSVAASCIALTLLICVVVLGSQTESELTTSDAAKKTKLRALFSFTSPVSLFPPSAIISLTDDNSTFFLARPAAFGPALPSSGLSGPLWIGSGFVEDTTGRSEFGCGDVTEVDDQDGTGPKPSQHADIQSLQEDAEIAGKVVLLKRGGCGFMEKVLWAQKRGGVAVVVGDNVRGGGLIRMYAKGDTSSVNIPAIFTSHTTAHLLSTLLPSEGMFPRLAPESTSKVESIKSKNTSKAKDSSVKKQDTGSLPGSAKPALRPVQTSKADTNAADSPETELQNDNSKDDGWLESLRHALGLGHRARTAPKGDGRRPPSSGNLDWVIVEHWDEDHPNQKPSKSSALTLSTSTATSSPDDFIIGEQDWRDPDMLPTPQSTILQPTESTRPKEKKEVQEKGANVIPGSGEYDTTGKATGMAQQSQDASEQSDGWISSLFADGEDETPADYSETAPGSTSPSTKASPSNTHANEGENRPEDLGKHDGLWVTLAPTNMSSSPLLDTLLVLVVSPLVTLSIVYALLLLRSRIRRRRWRAPKSVVERLPVRIYHTISDSNSSNSPPNSPPSPTSSTPLLQHNELQPTSSQSESWGRPRTPSEFPATSSSFQPNAPVSEEEKREAGLAEWRRRYGGRQKECVVCLEEYVDGVSRVMSLPCGHEFHADCITPWLVTRRRTCPICKGDVVRSLSLTHRNRNHPASPAHSPRFPHEDIDSVQAQVAETWNESPSSSRPVPMPTPWEGEYSEESDNDVEANWTDAPIGDGETGGRDIPRDRSIDLSNSMRDLSSTVTTVIWRGVDAIRGAAGLRRPSQDDHEVDRDR